MSSITVSSTHFYTLRPLPSSTRHRWWGSGVGRSGAAGIPPGDQLNPVTICDSLRRRLLAPHGGLLRLYSKEERLLGTGTRPVINAATHGLCLPSPKEDCSPQSCCPFIEIFIFTAPLYVNSIVDRLSLCLYIAQGDTGCQMQWPTCQFLCFILKVPPKQPCLHRPRRYGRSLVTSHPCSPSEDTPSSCQRSRTDGLRHTICFSVHSAAHLSWRRAGCPQSFLKRL